MKTRQGMTRVGWVVGTFVAVAVAGSSAQAQSAVPSGPEFAAELEAEAYRLHSMPARWSDAASLYVAAAQLRQREDPQARQNLFVAANLYYQAGDKQAAVMALESAGARAVSSGDAVLAAQMFANAAIVAEEAGMVSEGRRLRSRVADLAYAGGSGTRTRS
jgi:hypothetical protein